METLDAYLTRLASHSPTPGGGSAATIVAAVGAALVEMVARVCAGGASQARGAIEELAARGERARAALLAAGTQDERAFERVIEAGALRREDRTRGEAALQSALEGAAQAPLAAIALALDVQRAAAALLPHAGPNIVSDVGCAAEFGYAAVTASAYNVRVNHRYLRNAEVVERQAAALDAFEREAAALLTHVREAVARALGGL